jgi:hypothetical protein
MGQGFQFGYADVEISHEEQERSSCVRLRIKEGYNEIKVKETVTHASVSNLMFGCRKTRHFRAV